MYVGIYFRVFLSLLPLWVVDGNQCSEGVLTIHPERVVVKYGDFVEVNCSASGPHDGMGWEATVGNKPIEEDIHLITWTVEELTDWDVEAQCFINLEDEQCIKTLTVVMYKDLEHAPVLSANHTGPMIEGTTYLLQCAVYNVAPVRTLTVMWYRGDVLIGHSPADNSTERPSPVNVTASLRITPTKHDDGAQFRCEAELNLGQEGPQPPPPKMISQSVSITVHYGPVTTNCPRTIEISEGDNLETFCPSEGNPRPTVRWLRDGLSIDPSRPLSREDSGVYTVNVTGLLSFEDTIEVFVMYGPVFHCPSSYIVEEYTAHNLSCEADGYPRPDTQWLKDGEEVVLPEELSRGYGGQYFILANSTYGNASHLLDIKVLYPPSPIAELEDTEVDVVGSDVVLKCAVHGDPRPQYEWSYPWVSNVWVKTEDGVSLLHINGTTEANIGTYACFAFNKLGEARRSVRVTVKGVQASCPIQFSSANKPVNETVVEYNKNVSIRCSAPGHKEILWTVSRNHRITGDTWTEKALTDWNVKPICKVTLWNRDPCHKLFNVTLFKTPKDLSIRFQNHSGPLIKDKQYTLLCEIQNVAPIKNLVVNWYKKEINSSRSVKNETFPDNSIKTPQNVSSTLLIRATKSENGAQYWCEARLKLGDHDTSATSQPLSVTVYYGPVITRPNVSDLPVFKDYQEVLVCEAEGNPKPEIIWIFNNKSIKGGNLTIGTEMAGLIHCRASNEVDVATKTVKLVFKGLFAACPVEISPPSLVVRYGDSASATCRTLVPVSGMGWESTVGAVGLEEGVTELNWTVKELREWTMRPQCFINPEDGDQCQKELAVVVYKMPDSVTLTIGDPGPKDAGTTYILTCRIENFAPVQNLNVRWFKGGQMLFQEVGGEEDDSIGPQNKTYERQLIFKPSDNGAEYRCEAGLNLTSDPHIQSQPVLVTVHYPPSDSEGVSVLELERDTTLNCTADANPPPSYTWKTSGTHEKMGKTPVLPIDVAGNYTCTASNRLGSGTKHFIVVSRSSGTFWAIIGTGIFVIFVLCGGYGILKWRAGANSII